MTHRVERELAGRKLIIETGELAKQANGSVTVRYGDTMVLVTAVTAEKPKEGIDFLPLTVDYEEKLYAAGKIPGGFFKKEGRPTEKCILTSRLIDRPIRPLFPESFYCDVQITATVISADQQSDPDIPALVGASAALTISDIPFLGPVGAVRVGIVDGQLVANPTEDQRKVSSLDLIVTGTRDGIMMIEAGGNEVPEDELIRAMEFAQEKIREVISLIEELAQKAALPKKRVALYEPDRDLEEMMRKHLTGEIARAMRIIEKKERERVFDQINRAAMVEALSDYSGSARERLLSMLLDEKSKDFDLILKKIEEEELQKMIVHDKIRPDGRGFTAIRPIACQVGLLPRVHGSGLFTRGQTQVLSTVTLGAMSDEQVIDGLNTEEESKRFMHHYYMPPYSLGEARPLRGPGRREIGHGALAERGLLPVIPTEEEFPYAIRLVSEVLESNGSTSMASTCGSCLALMDAGVPIKVPIAGISIGLIIYQGESVLLTDIQGMEDFLGEMDFKVAGSRKGVTAIQMDTKQKGLPLSLLTKALFQARDARLEILDKMTAVIPSPRPSLSPYAPRVIQLVIHPDKIKDVIGPGGKIIHKITGETGVKIDIEDDGRIFIVTTSAEMGEKARKMIEDITRDAEVGQVYLGKVMRIQPFGAFVEIFPGKEGLVHISKLSHSRVGKVEDVVKLGDEIMVRVEEIDKQGRVNLTAKGLPGGEGGHEGTGAEGKGHEGRPSDYRHRRSGHGGPPRRDEERPRPRFHAGRPT